MRSRAIGAGADCSVGVTHTLGRDEPGWLALTHRSPYAGAT